MRVQLIIQPYEEETSLYEMLALLLPQSVKFTAAVAWGKRSGLGRLAPHIAELRARTGRARLIIGIDEGGATEQGLRLALSEFDEAFILHERGRTFHPKVYVLETRYLVHVFIGSNNLTAGGLVSNHEAGVLLALDPENTEDARLVSRINDYFALMFGDGDICVRLTSANVEVLVADARYEVGDEDRRRPGGAEAVIELDSLVDVGDESLFGRSHHRRPSLPPLPSESRPPSRGRRGPPGRDDGLTQLEAPRSSAVVRRWTKKLSESDALRPRVGRNPTDNLKLTQARHREIDHRRYFRETLFGDADWILSARGRERAIVVFEVEIDGQTHGSVALEISHLPSRAANQSNVPTWLHWGSIKDLIRAQDHSGKIVSLERFDDGSYRLTIGGEPVGPFIA